MVTYVATLDVPRYVVEFLARLRAADRRRIGTPKGSRALGPFRQAVLMLRWFRERGCGHCLARDAGVWQATGYRYLHEGIDVLAAQAPDLHEVLKECQGLGMNHLVLDGTLIETDRVVGTHVDASGRAVDAWYYGKHKAFGANVPSAPNGAPLWVSDAEPGSTPDITAARIHVLPACTKRPRTGCLRWPTADIRAPASESTTPSRNLAASSHQRLHPDIQTYNAAELKERWRALSRITISPSRISDIAGAALTLNRSWK